MSLPEMLTCLRNRFLEHAFAGNRRGGHPHCPAQRWMCAESSSASGAPVRRSAGKRQQTRHYCPAFDGRQIKAASFSPRLPW